MFRQISIAFITLLIHIKLNSQNEWGIYFNAANTKIIGKNTEYSKKAFSSISNFSERQPFYGSLISQTPTWHKSFGAWYKLPVDKEKIGYYIAAGVVTYGHKEELRGGKSEDFPYGFSQNLPPGDSNILIVNKFRNYFFNIGIKSEVKIWNFFFAEMQFSYAVNKNNQDKSVRIFRSVFDPYIYYKDGNERGKNYAFSDVNYNGIFFLQGGLNYQILNQVKIHLLYNISITPVNKHSEIKKLFYRGIGLQISYSAW